MLKCCIKINFLPSYGGKMQSFRVQSSFEIAPMSVQEYLPCANLSNDAERQVDTEKQVSLAIQQLQTFAIVSDDGVQDIFNSHAISQPDIACHSSCNDDHLYTFSSLHGNNTQVENTLPQDLQDEAKTKLEDIKKMYEDINKVFTIKCLPQTGSILQGNRGNR